MKVKEDQNILDISLQGYGTLNNLVKVASDNGFNLDEVPTIGAAVEVDLTLGNSRVKLFKDQQNIIFSNVPIVTTALLKANDTDVLSPADDQLFIYR